MKADGQSFYYYYFYLFIFGGTGSSLLVVVRGGYSFGSAQASRLSGCFCYRAQAPDARASGVASCGLSGCSSQALEHGLSSGGLESRQHVQSSRIRDRTCVPRMGGQIPNHCTTREVHDVVFIVGLSPSLHFQISKHSRVSTVKKHY